MHFTDPVYRHPYWPTWPLLEITRGCSHSRCRFCTMYDGVGFGVQPMEVIEKDLAELARTVPDARTIQLLSGNPLVLRSEQLAVVMERVHEYLPKMENIYTVGRVTDLRDKTVEELRELRGLGLKEISLGVESGDDWTLDRVDKGYHAEEVIAQCRKLDEAGIAYWLTFMNGIAGRGHSLDHAVHSAEVFNACNPLVVYVTSLVLFPGTPLLEDAERGEFEPLTERELLVETRAFLEHLRADCGLVTHHTTSIDLSCQDFLGSKARLLAELDDTIANGDMDMLSLRRSLTSGL